MTGTATRQKDTSESSEAGANRQLLHGHGH